MKITLVEANEILPSFDDKLRGYTERLIRKRKRMEIINAAVTGQHTVEGKYLIIRYFPVSYMWQCNNNNNVGSQSKWQI